MKLYEAFENDEDYYVVTGYQPGGELFKRILLYKNFNEDITAEIIQ